MKIAIWGSLNHGNFGDDVMNVIFALEIKKLGADPVLYRLDKELAKKYAIKTVDNMDDLLKDAMFSLIGGGSWLESRRLGLSYEHDFCEYLDRLQLYNIPFYVLSIGGDSRTETIYLTEDRINLFSHPLFKGGTVRLTGAVKTMNSLHKQVVHYPDIVLRSADYFLSPRSRVKTPATDQKKFRIGITAFGIEPHMLRLIRLIELFPFIYSDYELVFLSTHLPNYHFDYEYQYKGSAPNISNEHYIDLDGFHNFISSLDCIISSKLHPGIAALSCGIPFLWIPGYDKTREFLKSVGLSQFEFTRSKLISMLITKQIKRAVRNYPFDEINRQKAESGGHIKYLKELIESYSA